MIDREVRDQWEAVLANKVGRDLAWRILSYAGVFSVDTENDPVILYRKSGARNLAIRLMREMELSAPGSYRLMFEENLGNE